MPTPDYIRHPIRHPRPRSRATRSGALMLLIGVLCLAGAPAAQAASITKSSGTSTESSQSSEEAKGGSSLESAAAKASSTGRTVAMSLIGLAFAVAGIVLAFRRDFREAAGVFAVGIVAVLLATPAGINLLQDTVNSLFGS
jgi:hypothetical protein